MHTPHHTDARRFSGEERDHDRGDHRRSAEPRSWDGDDRARQYGRDPAHDPARSSHPGRYGYGRSGAAPYWGADRDADWRERQTFEYGARASVRPEAGYHQPTGQGGMMNAGAAEQGSPLFYGQSGWRPGEADPGQAYGYDRRQRHDDWDARAHGPGAEIWREAEPWSGQSPAHRDFEPDYLHWREAQMRNLDRDYLTWREERRQKFSQDFDDWRSRRATARAGETAPEAENVNVGDVADGGTGGGDDQDKRKR